MNQPTPLHTAFQAAYDKALAKNPSAKPYPKMHFPNFTISRAPDTGRNKGYLYIKDGPAYEADYLGKIAPDGTLTTVAMPNERHELLSHTVRIATTNPLELVQEIGRETGTCCCCGRTLTNPLSVQLGIGPICRGGWFPEAEQLPPVTTIDLGLPSPEIDFLPPAQIATPLTPEEEAKIDIQDIITAYTRLTPADRVQVISKIAIYEVLN